MPAVCSLYSVVMVTAAVSRPVRVSAALRVLGSVLLAAVQTKLVESDKKWRLKAYNVVEWKVGV